MQLIRKIYKAVLDSYSYLKLSERENKITFYAEDAASFGHFEAIITELTYTYKVCINYLTSDIHDPVFIRDDPYIRPFYIGSSFLRVLIFYFIKTRVFVMTMPDLETFQLKRSYAKVHYVYIFHNMLSTHMVFRKGAFDHYDTLFCVGPHHLEEVRKTELKYNLKKKHLVNYGYSRLDTILKNKGKTQIKKEGHEMRVLIAPSWGKNALLELCGNEILSTLAKTHFLVRVRPHPMTLKKQPKAMTLLREKYAAHKNIVFEFDVASTQSLYESDVMISDWSGAALDYAFGLEKPVIFIDVPRKVNNPEYENIDVIPFEVSVRNDIGKVISVNEFSRLPGIITELVKSKHLYEDAIKKTRDKSIFNIGNSGKEGAKAILEILEVPQ
ncbi:MAG: CDP-glycerol glycerophosphotransferase family protein [Deltaproteobacteria bacterium]|nr:CDP-glycerol glycerophosphotransferase family protein [Deltaproteobacteria bacterium]